MNIQKILSKHVKLALINSGIPQHYDPVIIQSLKKQKGDYQINGIMKIAKNLTISPMILAKKVIANICLYNICDHIEISEPGFINIYLKTTWIEKKLEEIIQCSRLGIYHSKNPKKIVIDYSSPNIAKEMHVGHLRSTIIGDTMVKIMEFYGHKVIRANHIGDWGTQFGILLAYLQNEKKINTLKKINLKALEKYYKLSKKMYLDNEYFAELSRKYVVKLQKKDKKIYLLWKRIVNVTIIENEKIYKILNTTLRNKDIKGESAYHNMIPDIIQDLKKKKLAVEKNNSIVVLIDNMKNKKNHTMGVVIQKKDGASLYASIDLACLKYRSNILNAHKIFYYTDSRQVPYLRNICEIAKKAGYINDNIQIIHHYFGMILSNNNKPFQTRSGNTIKLTDLIKESIERTKIIIKNKNPLLSEEEIQNKSAKIGIGAIKYADLSKNRTSNYIFNWNQILLLEGNTALYIQYTYTRILSIFRKGNISMFKLPNGINLKQKLEKKLGLKILQFEETIEQVKKSGYPHLICQYLYELSVLYSNFYQNYPILFLSESNVTLSRLKLSLLTAKTIKKGLYLLGIKTIRFL
ncbi:Arginine--tRNA ligase [Buchnera aphidicola (Eriosoma grossulariae)]|uniref:arginine--tRNA ligase n=1 Tax=Buchnera aphidicola TaxID=9 RepID=UPI00346463E7